MTEQEIYNYVAEKFDIPVSRVAEYDKKFWEQIKYSLNHPSWDVLEVPFIGSWTITRAKMRRTLKYHISMLKRSRKNLQKLPDSPKVISTHKGNIEIFRELWKLKQELKY